MCCPRNFAKSHDIRQLTFDDDGDGRVAHDLGLLLELLLPRVHELPLQHVLAPAAVGAVSLVILDTGNVMLCCYNLSTSCVMSCLLYFIFNLPDITFDIRQLLQCQSLDMVLELRSPLSNTVHHAS